MIYPKTVVFTGNVKGTTQNSLAVQKVSRTRPLSNLVYRTPNARTPVETKAIVVTRDQSSISRRNSRNSFQITAGFKGHVPLHPSMTRSPVAAISDQHSHQPLPLPRGEVMLEILEKNFYWLYFQNLSNRAVVSNFLAYEKISVWFKPNALNNISSSVPSISAYSFWLWLRWYLGEQIFDKESWSQIHADRTCPVRK